MKENWYKDEAGCGFDSCLNQVTDIILYISTVTTKACIPIGVSEQAYDMKQRYVPIKEDD